MQLPTVAHHVGVLARFVHNASQCLSKKGQIPSFLSNQYPSGIIETP